MIYIGNTQNVKEIWKKKIYLTTNFLRNKCYIDGTRLLGKFFGGIKERYLCLDPSSREREMQILRSGRLETFTHERRKEIKVT